MKRLSLTTCLLLLAMCSGCKMSDALFSVFGNSYTDGGYSQADKKNDYNRKVEAYEGSGSSFP